MTVDRTPTPCRHKRADHQHGTRAAYVLDICRCGPCAAANTAYENNRNRRTAYGRWQPYVDATPVRAHLEQLRDAGFGSRQIAELSGVARSAIREIRTGRGKVRPATAQRLLAVTPGSRHLKDGVTADAAGTRRRLQALVALGWPQAELARRLGILPTNLPQVITSDRVLVRTARAVRDLYEQMWDQRPPETTRHERTSATRARNHATDHGWVPPLAWDDDSIDDPAAAADMGEPARRDLVEDADWLIGNGCSIEEAAARFSITVAALRRAYTRAGRKAPTARKDAA